MELRKTLQFNNNEPWAKQTGEENFTIAHRFVSWWDIYVEQIKKCYK